MFRISGFITSAQKVTLLSSLVSLSAGLRRTTQMSLTKFDENDVAHGNGKKTRPLHFGGNPAHVTLQAGWNFRVRVWL